MYQKIIIILIGIGAPLNIRSFKIISEDIGTLSFMNLVQAW